MLQLEKIKELDTPTKLDKFKKIIKTQDDLNREIRTLDFFKTFKSKKKTNILDYAILPLCFFGLINMFYGSMVNHFHKNEIISESNNNYKIYSQLFAELEDKHTVSISSFKLLKSSPTINGDLLSSALIHKVLRDDKVPENIKKEIFTNYSQNWNSGLEKQKEYYKDCKLSIVCHAEKKRLESYLPKIEDNLTKIAIYARHPDIFKKQMELNELKIKYSTWY